MIEVDKNNGVDDGEYIVVLGHSVIQNDATFECYYRFDMCICIYTHYDAEVFYLRNISSCHLLGDKYKSRWSIIICDNIPERQKSQSYIGGGVRLFKLEQHEIEKYIILGNI